MFKTAILGVFGVASIAYAANSLAAERGWSPVIALAGAGDSRRAVLTLSEIVRLWDVARTHTRVDAATRDFLERATSSLKDFNLKRMYELLPEKHGRFRQLSVSGEFSAHEYQIGAPKTAQFEVGPAGVRQRLGDASLVLRATPVALADGDADYLMQGRAGVVVGGVDWSMVVDGAQQFLRLLGQTTAKDEGARPTLALRQKVLARNPKLGVEDVEPIATLWEAFPRLAEVLSGLGGVDDLLDSAAPASAQHMQALLHLDPKRMTQRYPELGEYLAELAKLFEADVRWLDANNRTLALLHVNSQQLSARVELFDNDGLLVPSVAHKPLVDHTLDTNLGVVPYSIRASANVRLLGVRSQLRDLRIDFEHERTARGMELRGHMRHVPSAKVSGAALGILPTGLIDALIPGDIESLIEKALETACKGNQGKGIELAVHFDRQPSGASANATLDGAVTFEAIDNFLVKFGVAHFTDHMLPSEAVRADVERLMRDVHSAFAEDLRRYAQAHGIEGK